MWLLITTNTGKLVSMEKYEDAALFDVIAHYTSADIANDMFFSNQDVVFTPTHTLMILYASSVD